MKILVTVDGSELAESVLPCASGLARRWGAELVVVRVVDPVLTISPDIPPSLTEKLRDQVLAEAQEYARNLQSRLGDLPQHTRVPVGSAPDQIARTAAREGCQAIIMASHGHSGAARWLLGSVAERVLRQAPCPVLLLRPPAPQLAEFHNVLVPVDGSEASLQVAEQVRPYLAEGATVTLLQVSHHLPGLPHGDAELDDNLQVVEGQPAPTIMSWAQEHQCDLIAMACHGRSGFRRLWLGSVTEKVARHSHCPLLVFPHPDRGSPAFIREGCDSPLE
ncbi:MAG: universal stress protein [Candidatus Eremiobacteraeota bacterium]|nr:universal stress protein [Candidatus Eremiobacteraeota bacterium]MCW5871557.1 universal stress protein [Candidatus Eremiobacteraeota bacterium]